jgi:serine protease DegQ
MLMRLWLLFAQISTVAVALLFVVSTLRPEWVRVPFFGAKQEANSAPSPISKTLTLPAPAVPAAQNGSVAAPVASYASAVKRALPAVVSIQTSRIDRRVNPYANDPIYERLFGKRAQEGQRSQRLGEGSGVIVSAEGHVLTNFHVIEGANDIEIMLVDGRMMKAKVIGTDPESDLAVLQVNEKNLPTMSIADSDSLQVGDVVLAMGNPYGIANTVTMGIISALARKRVSENNPFEDFIQTDAAINPGNSGGPLVNVNGDLVGINTAIFTRTGSTAGIGFSIPANLVKSTMEQIVSTGAVKRGYLGVSMADLDPRITQALGLPVGTRGALIAAVVGDEPASKAGIRAEDVVVQINGKPVSDQSEAISTIAGIKPGTTVPVTVLRRNEKIDLNVKLGERQPRVMRRE